MKVLPPRQGQKHQMKIVTKFHLIMSFPTNKWLNDENVFYSLRHVTQLLLKTPMW